MTQRGLRVSPDLTLPLDAVTETFAIIAKRRVGKSNAGVVMAEQMTDAGIPWVAIDPKGDWWGVRSSSDGKGEGLAVPVFGGLHADVPLEPTAGAYMADLIVERRLTAVLDTSQFSKADEIRFLQPFAERLLKVNSEPLHLFFEECDDYIPQEKAADELHVVRAFSRLIRHGGFKGIGSTLITQRAALVNKNVLAQTETLIVFRTTHPPDQKQVADWIKGHDAATTVLPTLSSLPVGEAWVLSPGFLGKVERVKFERRRTYDSGATPKIGQRRTEPTRLADVDLAAIKDAMAETIERAKADDPRELRKQIKALQQEALRLGRDRDDVAAELERERAAERVRVEHVPIFTQADEATMGDVEQAVMRVAAELTALRGSILERLPVGAKEGATADSRVSARPETPAPAVTAARPQAQRTPSVRRAGTPEVRPSPPRPGTDGPLDRLSRSQQAILDTLAWFESVRILAPLRSQVAWQAGVSPRSSGFEKNCSTLRTAGVIHYPGANRLGLTDEGRAVAVGPSTPATTSALQESILGHLSGSQRAIVLSLLDVYPDGLDREALADRCGVSARSSGFEKNCSTLRTLGLVDYPQTGVVAATELLFID